MRKKALVLTGAVLCTGLIAVTAMSKSPTTQKARMADFEDVRGKFGVEPPAELLSGADGSAFAIPGNSFGDTDWEFGEGWCPGFVCGSAFAGCNIKATGNLADNCGVGNNAPNGFWLSGSARSCAEPHIDTVNPFSGSQHLRFAYDDNSNNKSDLTPCAPGVLTSNCRLSLFSPIECADPSTCINDASVGGSGCCLEPLPPAPNTITAYVAVESAFGSRVEYSTQNPNIFGLVGLRLIFDIEAGTVLAYDPGTGDVDTGVYVQDGGAYHEVVMHGAACDFEYIYYYDFTGGPEADLIYTAGVTSDLPTNIGQYVILTDNGPTYFDIDDIDVDNGDLCPSSCGNGLQEPGEQCDGGDDAECANGCADDCTCNCRAEGDFNCDNGLTLLDNGANGPYVGHGGWFIYFPDTPAVAWNDCGSLNADTGLTGLWAVFGGSLGFAGYMTDCDSAPLYSFQAPADPLAPCYDSGPDQCDGGPDDGDPCNTDADCISGFFCTGGGKAGALCNPANGDADCQGFCVQGPNAGGACVDNADCAGLVCVGGGKAGLTCAVTADCQVSTCQGCEIPGTICTTDADCNGEVGACKVSNGQCLSRGSCNTTATCDSDSACLGTEENGNDCACFEGVYGLPLLFQHDYFGPLPVDSTVYVNIEKRRDCDTPITTGACCNALDGSCTDGHADASECDQVSDVFLANKDCNGLVCPVPDIPLGTCCDRVNGICTPDAAAADCVEGGDCASAQCIWTSGMTCGEVDCAAAEGACCDGGSGLPGSGSCSVTTLADCGCDACAWYKDTGCDELDQTQCATNAIPTVSEWGLVVLSLLLLIGAKVYFGRRTAVA